MLKGLYRIKEKWFSEDKILIRGAGLEAHHIFLFCLQQELPVMGFLADGKKVVLLHSLPLFDEKPDGYVVIESIEELWERDPKADDPNSFCLCESGWERQREMLLLSGVPNDRIYVDYYHLENVKGYYVVTSPNLQNQISRYHARQIRQWFLSGKAIFERLSTDQKSQYVLPQYFGSGDLIWISAMMRVYKEKYNDKKLVVLTNKERKEIPLLYPSIDEVVVLDEDSLWSLKTYFRLSPGLDKQNICDLSTILSAKFGLQETEGIPWAESKQNVAQQFFRRALGLEGKGSWEMIPEQFLRPQSPKERRWMETIEAQDAVLIIPKTNFINVALESDPDTKGYAGLMWRFLADLAQEWKSCGKTVYCNIGSPDDFLLPGTLPLALTIRELLAVCKSFRMIYSIRTGLADILAFSGCPLRVLYPASVNERWEYLNGLCNLQQLNENIVNDYWSPEGGEELKRRVLEESRSW